MIAYGFVLAIVLALVITTAVVEAIERRLAEPAPYSDTSRGTRR